MSAGKWDVEQHFEGSHTGQLNYYCYIYFKHITIKKAQYAEMKKCKNNNDTETIMRAEKLFHKLTLMWAYKRFFDKSN